MQPFYCNASRHNQAHILNLIRKSCLYLDLFFQAYEEDSNRPDLSEPARQSLITRHQLALVDCEDANNNTPLSEAAGGGHEDTIKMLIQRGANVNSRGRYQRVPLWRAAFGGHLQAVQVRFLDKCKFLDYA